MKRFFEIMAQKAIEQGEAAGIGAEETVESLTKEVLNSFKEDLKEEDPAALSFRDTLVQWHKEKTGEDLDTNLD